MASGVSYRRTVRIHEHIHGCLTLKQERQFDHLKPEIWNVYTAEYQPKKESATAAVSLKSLQTDLYT
jgi:hypothetical protein